MTKKLINEEVTTFDIDNYTAERVIMQCESLIKLYGKNKVLFEYTSERYSDGNYIAVMVERLENDSEYAERLATEQGYRDMADQREHAEFIRLSAKFAKSTHKSV